MLKFAMWVEWLTSYAAMGRVPMSARAQFRGSREHSVEMWCVAPPINCESYTAMSKVYLHIRKCNCTSFMLIYSLPLVLHHPKSVLLVVKCTKLISPVFPVILRVKLGCFQTVSWNEVST